MRGEVRANGNPVNKYTVFQLGFSQIRQGERISLLLPPRKSVLSLLKDGVTLNEGVDERSLQSDSISRHARFGDDVLKL
jgi:hypothetical protein